MHVAALFAHGFDHTSVLMVTGPDGPTTRVSSNDQMITIRVGDGARAGGGDRGGGEGCTRLRPTVAGLELIRLMLGLLRLRVALVTLMMSVVALAAGDIFDRRVWWLLAPPRSSGWLPCSTCPRRWPVRLAWGSAP